MFEVGWTEILVIAIVALIVFPTKDLPRLLRTVGQLVGKARRMAGDMQAQFNQALREVEREADLTDLKSSVQNANPLIDLKKTFDPVRTLGDDLKKSVTAPIPPKAAEQAVAPASPESQLPPQTQPPTGTETLAEKPAVEVPASGDKDGSAA